MKSSLRSISRILVFALAITLVPTQMWAVGENPVLESLQRNAMRYSNIDKEILDLLNQYQTDDQIINALLPLSKIRGAGKFFDASRIDEIKAMRGEALDVEIYRLLQPLNEALGSMLLKFVAKPVLVRQLRNGLPGLDEKEALAQAAAQVEQERQAEEQAILEAAAQAQVQAESQAREAERIAQERERQLVEQQKNMDFIRIQQERLAAIRAQTEAAKAAEAEQEAQMKARFAKMKEETDALLAQQDSNNNDNNAPADTDSQSDESEDEMQLQPNLGHEQSPRATSGQARQVTERAQRAEAERAALARQLAASQAQQDRLAQLLLNFQENIAGLQRQHERDVERAAQADRDMREVADRLNQLQQEAAQARHAAQQAREEAEHQQQALREQAQAAQRAAGEQARANEQARQERQQAQQNAQQPNQPAAQPNANANNNVPGTGLFDSGVFGMLNNVWNWVKGHPVESTTAGLGVAFVLYKLISKIFSADDEDEDQDVDQADQDDQAQEAPVNQNRPVNTPTEQRVTTVSSDEAAAAHKQNLLRKRAQLRREFYKNRGGKCCKARCGRRR